MKFFLSVETLTEDHLFKKNALNVSLKAKFRKLKHNPNYVTYLMFKNEGKCFHVSSKTHSKTPNIPFKPVNS